VKLFFRRCGVLGCINGCIYGNFFSKSKYFVFSGALAPPKYTRIKLALSVVNEHLLSRQVDRRSQI
jgi:hypothetical protein